MSVTTKYFGNKVYCEFKNSLDKDFEDRKIIIKEVESFLFLDVIRVLKNSGDLPINFEEKNVSISDYFDKYSDVYSITSFSKGFNVSYGFDDYKKTLSFYGLEYSELKSIMRRIFGWEF